MLSFVMMIACAFTFTTYKASASTNNVGIAGFARAVARRIVTDDLSVDNGDYYRAVMLVDGQLFEDDVIIGTTTTTGDLIQTTFILSLADELNILINNAATGTVGDLPNFFNSVGLELLIHLTGYRYLRFTTSSTITISSVSQFLSRTNTYRNSNTAILASTAWEIPSNLLTLLEGLGNQLNQPTFVYPAHNDEIAHDTLTFQVYNEETDSFVIV